MSLELSPGAARRRLGNFRTAELTAAVREVLDAAGIASTTDLDPTRPELLGRLLDRLVVLAGDTGQRVWVPADRLREARRALTAARRGKP